MADVSFVFPVHLCLLTDVIYIPATLALAAVSIVFAISDTPNTTTLSATCVAAVATYRLQCCFCLCCLARLLTYRSCLSSCLDRMLLDVGADGNLPNKELQTPVHLATICDAHLDILGALLAARCSPNVFDHEVRFWIKKTTTASNNVLDETKATISQ